MLSCKRYVERCRRGHFMVPLCALVVAGTSSPSIESCTSLVGTVSLVLLRAPFPSVPCIRLRPPFALGPKKVQDYYHAHSLPKTILPGTQT